MTLAPAATLPPPHTLAIPATALGHFGSGLHRPECVLATASGTLFISDKRGGIMRIATDGTQHLGGTSCLIPNRFALQRDGSFLVANMGDDGGVWHIDPRGQASPWLVEFDGQRLPKRSDPPLLGEGARALLEGLGLPAAEIDALAKDGVVGLAA